MNRKNVFRKFSILSYEDKQMIHEFASHLFKLQPIKAFKVLYWWFTNESFRFSPIRIYENYQNKNFDKKHNVDTALIIVWATCANRYGVVGNAHPTKVGKSTA